MKGIITLPVRFAAGLCLVCAVTGAGCEDTVQSVPPPAGPATVTVHIQGRDEYSRGMRFPGGAQLALVAGVNRWLGTVPTGDTCYSFYGVPSQSYLLRISRDGYYDSRVIVWSGERTIDMYKRPDTDFRVDSVVCLYTSSPTKLTIRLILHRPIPAGGHYRAALFLGRTAEVSDKTDSYFFSTLAGSLYGVPADTSVVDCGVYYWTDDLTPGATVYVTARLGSGASEAFSLGGPRYYITNIEHNSTVVGSFVY